jgi:hypothetical protein
MKGTASLAHWSAKRTKLAAPSCLYRGYAQESLEHISCRPTHACLVYPASAAAYHFVASLLPDC